MDVNNKWQNADEIFYPSEYMEYPVLGDLRESKYLKYSDYDAITRTIYQPLRTIYAEEKKFTYFPQGDMTKEIVYTILFLMNYLNDLNIWSSPEESNFLYALIRRALNTVEDKEDNNLICTTTHQSFTLTSTLRRDTIY